MRLIADIYDRPSMDFRNKADRQTSTCCAHAANACREDLPV